MTYSNITKVTIVIFAGFLAGCSAEHRAALAYADEQAKAFKDTEAAVLMRAPCQISIGAYWRALNEDQRMALDKLCGK